MIEFEWRTQSKRVGENMCVHAPEGERERGRGKGEREK